MIYISVAEAAKKWGMSERSARNYCAEGRVPGARLSGKTWEIPNDAEKPKRATRSDKKRTLLDILREDKADSASLAYRSIDMARAQGYNVVIIDSAGRLQNKFNLIEELKKIKNVIYKKSKMTTLKHC